MLLLLSERGICASAGAACSSGSLEPSPVIAAMGLPPEVAHGTLRFTIGRETTMEHGSRAAAVIGECARRLAGAG
jgi:cysteine desulfurase